MSDIARNVYSSTCRGGDAAPVVMCTYMSAINTVRRAPISILEHHLANFTGMQIQL